MTKRSLAVASTQQHDHRARLVSSNGERFAHHKRICYFFNNKNIFFVLVCIHPGNARVPPWVLAQCGGNINNNNNELIPPDNYKWKLTKQNKKQILDLPQGCVFEFVFNNIK